MKDGRVTFDTDRDTLRKLWEKLLCAYGTRAFWRLWEISLRRCEDRRFDRPGRLDLRRGLFSTQVTINDTESYQIETLVLPPPVFKDGSPYAVSTGRRILVVKSDESGNTRRWSF